MGLSDQGRSDPGQSDLGLSSLGLAVTAFSPASVRRCFTSSGVRPARSDRPGSFRLPARAVRPARSSGRPGTPARPLVHQFSLAFPQPVSEDV